MAKKIEHYDVIVVGGGSSGLMAAGRAGELGKKVLLLEKNPKLGEKLKITGGGRCNVTNAEDDIHTLLKHYGDGAPFLYSPFSQFGMKDTFTFLKSEDSRLWLRHGSAHFQVPRRHLMYSRLWKSM